MTTPLTFRTTVELGGKTATGFEVPAEVVEALGQGRRPSVRVSVGGHTYRSTVAVMAGRFLLPLSAENRTAAGVAAGDEIEVVLEADTAQREVTVPEDLAAALADHPAAREFFDAMSYTHRKEWVRWIEDAKKPETRAGRVQSTVDGLRSGKRTR
jgi:hypothetical protein